MKAIGLDRRMRGLAGLHRTMMVSSFLRATGTEIEGTYNMIIGGTAIEAPATTVAITGMIRITAMNKAAKTIITLIIVGSMGVV
jgi:hypothetical protein